MTDELAARRDRVRRTQTKRREVEIVVREVLDKIDITDSLGDDECRVMLRYMLDDLARLSEAVERARPGTMTVGLATIDAAIELLKQLVPAPPGA